MNLRAAQADHVPDSVVPADGPTADPGMKFMYPSGSRPLDGYTIKRGIGRGGFGEVYFAVSDGGKEVALKLIRRNFDVELRGVAQCLNLKHPNLLGLHDVRSDERDDRWVVMEHVAGDCLEEVIEVYPKGMPVEEVTAWIHGIASGVAYLHECGIVHRDLKPGNIFSDNGLVKIGDYGLSKFISCSRRSGQTESVGTVHYMAPEIGNGRYGKEIDIYALGIMLYEMLTGQVPFNGESVGEVLMKHLTAEPDLAPLSEPYRSIVRRALAKDPRVRYGSAAELLADLPLPTGVNSRAHHQPRVTAVNRSQAIDPAEEQRMGTATAQEPLLATAVVGSHDIVGRRDEEPVFRWLKQSLATLGRTWSNQFNTAVKIASICFAIWLILRTADVLFPSLIFLAMIYLVYRGCWSLGRWLSPSSKPLLGRPPTGIVSETQTNMAAYAYNARPDQASPPRRRRRWHRATVPGLPAKSTQEKITELSGSMLIGAVVCLVMSLVMLLLRGVDALPEQYAWLAITSIAGTWGILIPSKFWEGRGGEPALRRFCMLVAGLIVGAAACGVQHNLWVGLPHEFSGQQAFAVASGAATSPASELSPEQLFAPASLMTYLSFFGFLYLLVRWWRLADPLRSTRLSLWSTAVAVTWAGALYLFWPFPANWAPFPQPWGFMFAATVAVAVQIASPWSDRSRQTSTQTA